VLEDEVVRFEANGVWDGEVLPVIVACELFISRVCVTTHERPAKGWEKLAANIKLP